jgi:hypothetical protein
MMMNECAGSFGWPADLRQFPSLQPSTCGVLLGLWLYLVMLEGAQLEASQQMLLSNCSSQTLLLLLLLKVLLHCMYVCYV